MDSSWIHSPARSKLLSNLSYRDNVFFVVSVIFLLFFYYLDHGGI